MGDILALLQEAHEAHVAAHGPRCGVVVGGRNHTDPCILLRRAWAGAFRTEAYTDRHKGQGVRHKRYRANHKEKITAYKSTDAYREKNIAYQCRWRATSNGGNRKKDTRRGDRHRGRLKAKPPRVIRMADLTADQRRLVLAFVEMAKSPPDLLR